MEHGEALDRMDDARNLVVAILGQSGNEKEVTKHLKAWSQGKSPYAKPTKKEKIVSEEEMARMRKLREAADRHKAAKGR